MMTTGAFTRATNRQPQLLSQSERVYLNSVQQPAAGQAARRSRHAVEAIAVNGASQGDTARCMPPFFRRSAMTGVHAPSTTPVETHRPRARNRRESMRAASSQRSACFSSTAMTRSRRPWSSSSCRLQPVNRPRSKMPKANPHEPGVNRVRLKGLRRINFRQGQHRDFPTCSGFGTTEPGSRSVHSASALRNTGKTECSPKAATLLVVKFVSGDICVADVEMAVEQGNDGGP